MTNKRSEAIEKANINVLCNLMGNHDEASIASRYKTVTRKAKGANLRIKIQSEDFLNADI